MYVAALLVLLFFNILFDRSLTKNSFLFYSLFFFLAFIVVFISLLSVVGGLDFVSEKYFGTFSPDSHRYVHEVDVIINNFVFANELKGTIGEYYSATPKMGLSSLIGLLGSLLGLEGRLAYYLMMNLFFIFLTYFILIQYFDLAKFLNLSLNLTLLGALLLFFFPIDLYWNYKFLREPIAHILMLGSFISLSLVLIKGNKYYRWALFYSLFTILFRAQLAFVVICFQLALVFSLFDVKKTLNVLFSSYGLFLLVISLLAISQTIRAAGLGFFQKIENALGSGGTGDFVSNLILLDSIFYWCFSFLIFFLSFKSKVFREITEIKIFFVFAFAAAMFFVILAFDVQIRFLYPLLYTFKVYLVFIILFYRRRPDLSRSIGGAHS